MPRLNAQQTRGVILRLESLAASRPDYAQMLREEKWQTLGGLRAAFAFPDWRKRIAWSVGSPGSGSTYTMSAAQQMVFLNTISKQRVLNNYLSFTDSEIQRATQPYRNIEVAPATSDIISSHLMASSLRTRWSFTRNETQTSLLLVALALHAAKIERGSYPTELDKLAPRFLKRVPLDPFSNRSLHYKTTPIRFINQVVENKDKSLRNEYSAVPYTLYSVGGDTKDDKGKPVANSIGNWSATARQLYRINFESKGDIVAGINVG
jgi:hypothetical protein